MYQLPLKTGSVFSSEYVRSGNMRWSHTVEQLHVAQELPLAPQIPERETGQAAQLMVTLFLHVKILSNLRRLTLCYATALFRSSSYIIAQEEFFIPITHAFCLSKKYLQTSRTIRLLSQTRNS